MAVTIVSNGSVEVAESSITTTKVVVTVEYDGTRYYGFQLQANLPTIQSKIEEALCKLTGERTRVVAASRTDTGVHARGQVISFRSRSSLPPQTFVKGLNYYLPGDIAVKEAFKVRDSFDVRRDALYREYDYYILNSLTRSPTRRGFSCLVAGHLDIDAMNRACQALVGRHDFASFATSLDDAEAVSTVRNVRQARVVSKGDLVTFNMVANSFLRHQVRNTVGSIIRVGLNKMTVDEFYSIIEARSPGRAGPAAPPQGLCLMQISYPVPLGEMNHEDI